MLALTGDKLSQKLIASDGNLFKKVVLLERNTSQKGYLFYKLAYSKNLLALKVKL